MITNDSNYNATSNKVATNIYCKGDYACLDSKIDGFSGIIVGGHGLVHANVANGKYIVCFASLGCFNCTITAVSTVVITGAFGARKEEYTVEILAILLCS